MCLLCKSYVKKDSKSNYLLSIQSIRICFCITLFAHFFLSFFFFFKSCNHILEWNSLHLVSRSAACSTANEVLMSWVYLLQVNVSCNWKAEKQQSHNNRDERACTKPPGVQFPTRTKETCLYSGSGGLAKDAKWIRLLMWLLANSWVRSVYIREGFNSLFLSAV